MHNEQDINNSRELIRSYERDRQSSRWLIRQLSKKLAHFPRDVLRRARRSINKRRWTLVFDTDKISSISPASVASRPVFPFSACPEMEHRLDALVRTRPDVRSAIAEMTNYCNSDFMQEQVAQAVALDPNVGKLHGGEIKYCAPWHDADYARICDVRKLLPAGTFDSIILMPFGKLGGADFVAGVLANAVAASGRTLILRTDASGWERPDWYPESVISVDLSYGLARIINKPLALYVLMQEIAPIRIYNVNSRLAFDMFAKFGGRLAVQFDLYAYYFCADRTPDGVDAGYPVWYFANVLPHLKAALIDTEDLAETLAKRYALPKNLRAKLCTIYTPALTVVPETPVATLQLERRAARKRPRLLWAGRLDKQKRFDLFLQIAAAMPDVDFDCWGKAVLDPPPDLKSLPPNVTLHPPFSSYDQLPLANSDGWIYTSAWDGLPTILIEIAALGVPITASAVGGVPELIDDDTGWPVRDASDMDAYVTALREMLKDSDLRIGKAKALQARVRARHTKAAYAQTIGSI
jgi:glycosyltransferase involved in cell wall biosynthesis